MTIDEIISILRNPWGHDSQAIMTARIEAADILEKMIAAPVAAQPQDQVLGGVELADCPNCRTQIVVDLPLPQEATILAELANRFADVPHEMWQSIEVANLLREHMPAAQPSQDNQQAGQARELPPLPAAVKSVEYMIPSTGADRHYGHPTKPYYTAEQMREYARAAKLRTPTATAAAASAQQEQEPPCNRG